MPYGAYAKTDLLWWMTYENDAAFLWSGAPYPPVAIAPATVGEATHQSVCNTDACMYAEGGLTGIV